MKVIPFFPDQLLSYKKAFGSVDSLRQTHPNPAELRAPISIFNGETAWPWFLHCKHPGEGTNSALIRRIFATGILNLPPCSRVEKPKKYTLFWNQEIMQNYVLYCIVLYCIVLYCIVLYCIVLYCIVLYCIVLYCIVLYRIVLYCIVLYCIVLYCIVLYCIVLYCMTIFMLYLFNQIILSSTLK